MRERGTDAPRAVQAARAFAPPNTVALDCIYVQVGTGSHERDAVGRLAIVDSSLRVLLDTACRPAATVTDYRTLTTGLDAAQLASAPDFAEVRKQAAALLEGKTVVGADLPRAIRSLGAKVPQRLQKDIQTSAYMIVGEPPASRAVSKTLWEVHREVYGEAPAAGGRDAVQNACAAMKLYLRARVGWERGSALCRRLRGQTSGE